MWSQAKVLFVTALKHARALLSVLHPPISFKYADGKCEKKTQLPKENITSPNQVLVIDDKDPQVLHKQESPQITGRKKREAKRWKHFDIKLKTVNWKHFDIN